MTESSQQQPNPIEDPSVRHRDGIPLRPAQRFTRSVRSLRTKLTLLTLCLFALLTIGSALVVVRNIDQVLYDALIERGGSLAQSTATPAGFSILAGDHLALDHLAARITSNQNDILYLAILDHADGILAHSQLEETGTRFVADDGEPLVQSRDFAVRKVGRNARTAYEFQAPINFSDSLVGSVVIGIDADTLLHARQLARTRISLLSLAIMLFGALGTFYLSRLITAPIERLAKGVAQLTAGDHQVEVRVTSRDELGELTRSFNEMSRVILSQKQSLEDYAGNLEDAYISTVRILAAALDARDNYTYGHSARVARLSLLIGARLGLDTRELKELEMGCFLHDIGKIHVPDLILNKPTPLDRDQYQVIQRHPLQGAEILGLAESLRKYVPMVLHHHEWYNGQGYPHGLRGEEIHLFAQIVAIADSYDAMTSSRPYRQGCTRDEAVAEIKAFRGVQFNPRLVDLFIEVLGDFKNDAELFSTGAHHASQNHIFTASASSAAHRAERLRHLPALDRAQDRRFSSAAR